MIRNNLKILLFSIIFTILPLKSYSIELIRDSEIENYIKDILHPILDFANIPQKSISVYIVQDDTPNAFVYDGMNVFIHTGLIQMSESYNVIEGVLAHEVGHIAGAHILKSQNEIKNILLSSAVYTLLAAGAIAAGGTSGNAGDLLFGGLLATSQIAERKVLSFSRQNEQEADEFAIRYLKSTHSSPQGILALFSILKNSQMRFIGNIDKYTITHPLTSDRITFIKNSFDKSYPNTEINKHNLQTRHEFILAKLAGYFANSDNLYFAKEYAHNKDAALYRLAFESKSERQYQNAERNINLLKTKYPNNPYFYELSAEINVNLKQYKSTEKDYIRALELLHGDFNILFAYGQFLAMHAKRIKQAIQTFEQCLIIEPGNIPALLELAKIYGQIGNANFAKLYIIEIEIAKENTLAAREAIKKLEENLKIDNNVPNADLRYIRNKLEFFKRLLEKK